MSPGSQHVLGLAGLAQREHRIVLQQPELVGVSHRRGGGEALHGVPDRLVGLPAELADDPGPDLQGPLDFRMGTQGFVRGFIFGARFGLETAG